MATAERQQQQQQQRHIAIAVDLSKESAFAVRWAVENYLREGDSVVLLHVSPTPVLYGADWGSAASEEERKKKKSDDGDKDKKKLDSSTAHEKVKKMGEPLERANIPFKVHLVKDHDMKERLCLEMERLSPSAVIMGSRGIGASSASSTIDAIGGDGGQGGLGSVSDYCVRHCVCPVVVVRHPNPKEAAGKNKDDAEPIVKMHSGSDLDAPDDDY